MLTVKSNPKATLKQLEGDGTGAAVIATLNVIDKDGDVTLPGAFGTQTAKMVPAHDWGHVPLGKGSIKEAGDDVVAEFAMNLEIASAADWYKALKFDLENGPALQEWSYGFQIEDASFGEFEGQQVRFLRKLKVHEFSPVMVGAGENTRTLAMKAHDGKRAVPSHSTAVIAGAWDGAANVRLVRPGEKASYYSQVYAWCAPEGDMGQKASWRFPHHAVSADGEPGAANTRAVIACIAALNGARGGTTISDADRKSVYDHLARHLRDADLDVPELRGYEECAVKLADQVRLVLWDAEAAVARAKSVQAVREADNGRPLSPDRIADLAGLKNALAELSSVATALDGVLRRGDENEIAANIMAEIELRSRSILHSA